VTESCTVDIEKVDLRTEETRDRKSIQLRSVSRTSQS